MAERKLKLAQVHPGGIVHQDTLPELWLGLQQDFELDLARDTAAAQIEREVLPRAS